MNRILRYDILPSLRVHDRQRGLDTISTPRSQSTTEVPHSVVSRSELPAVGADVVEELLSLHAVLVGNVR